MDLEQRMDRVERRLDATLKIVQTGMKMLVKIERENREFRKETKEAIHALIDSQLRTDAKVRELTDTVQALSVKFDRFIDSLHGRNGSNGRRRS